MIRYTIAFCILGVVVSSPSSMMAAPTGDLKIWDGDSIFIRDIPYMVSVHRKYRMLCGGSLIHSNVVLTSSHCIFTTNITLSSNYTVRVGSEQTNQGGLLLFVSDGKKYASEKIGSDIALLRLSVSVFYSDTVQRIRLAPKDYVVNDGDMMTVAGWGHMRNGSYPDILQIVELPAFNFAECKKMYHYLTPNFMCAGYKDGGKNVCNGDRGGPLVHNGLLVGVVSGYHHECAIANFPAFFTKISDVLDWIHDYIKSEG